MGDGKYQQRGLWRKVSAHSAGRTRERAAHCDGGNRDQERAGAGSLTVSQKAPIFLTVSTNSLNTIGLTT